MHHSIRNAVYGTALCGSLLWIGCYRCPPPVECEKTMLKSSGKKLESRITRHYSLRPKRKYYVYRDSADNYIQEGADIHYFLNGQIKMKEHFTNGKREGLTEIWHPNGQKMGEMRYANGKLDGESISWYENGKVQSKKKWVAGTLDGLEVHYDKKGNVIKKIVWENNKIIDKWNSSNN